MRITSRHLRQLIREELLREEENPGSALAAAISRGATTREQQIADAMTETYDWFVRTIFPAIEYNQWSPPIVADKNYLIAPDGRFLDATVDMGDPSTAGIYIKAGTEFRSPSMKYSLSYRLSDGLAGTPPPMSLEHIYNLLEDTAVTFKLPVTMQSFPD